MSCNICKDGPAPGKGKVGTHGGPRHWTNRLYFPGGLELTRAATKQQHLDLKVCIILHKSCGHSSSRVDIEFGPKLIFTSKMAISGGQDNYSHRISTKLLC